MAKFGGFTAINDLFKQRSYEYRINIKTDSMKYLQSALHRVVPGNPINIKENLAEAFKHQEPRALVQAVRGVLTNLRIVSKFPELPEDP